VRKYAREKLGTRVRESAKVKAQNLKLKKEREGVPPESAKPRAQGQNKPIAQLWPEAQKNMKPLCVNQSKPN
jgi:hypothetical protein